MEIRTLCTRCKEAYRSAGYRVCRIENQEIKGECEICRKSGYDYYIKKNQQNSGGIMCNHSNMTTVNNVKVCLNCGLTITGDGKVIFDKKIVNYKSKKKKK